MSPKCYNFKKNYAYREATFYIGPRNTNSHKNCVMEFAPKLTVKKIKVILAENNNC